MYVVNTKLALGEGVCGTLTSICKQDNCYYDFSIVFSCFFCYKNFNPPIKNVNPPE